MTIMATEASRKKSAKGELLSPSSSSSCLISNLPDSILMEILCRLPIKTLAACKRVCKSWLHLIRDPHFSQLHQARSPTSTHVFFQQLSGIDTTKLHMGNFDNLDDVKLTPLFELPRFTVSPENVVTYKRECVPTFANSCNGLLCYHVKKTKTVRFAVVCNPCTREFITFPPPRVCKGFADCRGYGLGFSRKANKFKLLRLRDRKIVTASEVVVVAEICAIEKACSWEIVDQLLVSYPIEIVSSGTYLGYTLHWAIQHNSGISILTFDFEHDRFGRIQLPPKFGRTPSNRNGEGVGSCREILGVSGGCLCVTDNTNEGMRVWLMKEYGVQDSWTEEVFYRGYPFSYLPITYMDNGDILMTCTHPYMCKVFVLSYNPLVKRGRLIGTFPKSIGFRAFTPSLVMLKDCMLGYDVHVAPRCVDLRPRETSTNPKWWTYRPLPLRIV